MPVRHSRWSIPLLLAVGAWVGVTRVSAEPGSAVEPAPLDPVVGDAVEDSLALGGDPIETSRLLPGLGFS